MSGFDDSMGARARSWSKGAEALEPKRHKVRGSSFSRPRGDSISGRLRSASDLCDSGLISREDKGTLKDLIIQDHPDLGHAFDEIEKGNPDTLRRTHLITQELTADRQLFCRADAANERLQHISTGLVLACKRAVI